MAHAVSIAKLIMVGQHLTLTLPPEQIVFIEGLTVRRRSE